MDKMDFYKMAWLSFYILEPWRRWRSTQARKWQYRWRRITGKWYCEECGVYHGRRVISYSLDGETEHCYFGLEQYAAELVAEGAEQEKTGLPKLIAQCEYIKIGGRDETYIIKRDFAERVRKYG